MKLEWIPEAFPASGTIGAAGFSKLLGRPEMDPLTVLVRETAQNSWDARDKSGKPVRFSIAGRQMRPDELATLRHSVFVDHELAHGTELDAVLRRPQVAALFLSDRQTKGLGGPLLASVAEESGVYDWADFVLNVGKANTQGLTGGTYGFGKTITYVVSEARSIVIHSRARFRGEIVSRFMACAIGDEFSRGGSLFTGRHWWGIPASGASTPIEGSEADELAKAIGMPSFEAEDLGTNILVVAPGFGGRAPAQAMNFMAEAVLWHLWPKTVDHDGSVPMDIRVEWEGADVRIPLPEERPPLHGFVQAFQAMNGAGVNDASPGYQHVLIERTRPKKTIVGDLATLPMVVQPRAVVDDGHNAADEDSPLPAAAIRTPHCHHVALLRSPELVVEYLEGPPAPEGGMEWAGVFRTRDAHDTVFALAEPPTHDSWRPDLLQDPTERSTVKKALQDIKIVLSTRWGERRPSGAPTTSSAAVVAERLAHLVGASAGSGASPDPRDVGPRSKALKARVELLDSRPIMIGNAAGSQARVRIMPKTGSPGTWVTISVGVALDGTFSDHDLDPSVRLDHAQYSDSVIPLSGTRTRLLIAGSTPTDLEIAAARSASLSLLFDVDVEAATDLSLEP